MSDLSVSSYCKSNKCDSGGISPIILILLLCLCGGDSGILGGSGGGCGIGGGCGDGLGGILPIILILCMCGGF